MPRLRTILMARSYIFTCDSALAGEARLLVVNEILRAVGAASPDRTHVPIKISFRNVDSNFRYLFEFSFIQIEL